MTSGVGWAGSVSSFLENHSEDVIAHLQRNYPPSATQATAWEATIHHFRNALEPLVHDNPESADWWIIFEYELPREGGRRPDVCILTSTEVIMLEVKHQKGWDLANFEQARAYIRDLQHYHLESRERDVSGFLFVLGDLDLDEIVQGTGIIGPKRLRDKLGKVKGKGITAEQAENWLKSEYHPLPKLIEAAKYVWDREPLPQIRSAKSANIPTTLKRIRDTINKTRQDQTNRLLLLTGPPGSGKTLVGLQSVYDLVEQDGAKHGTYLSGNGPLIQVLQHTLKTKEFVQDVHRFIREYGIHKRSKVSEDFLVFDEAQRAWNAEKLFDFYSKKNIQDPPSKSEPDLFIEAADETGKGITVLALIGTGQEIHSGEQSGLSLWAEAIKKSDRKWEMIAPPELEGGFPGHQLHLAPELSLGMSLRSHVAEKLHSWAEAVVGGRFDEAKNLAEKLREDYFFIYVTQDLETAKAFLRNRYHEESGKTYGMITSSKARNLKEVGVDITMFGKDQVRLNRDEAAWYVGKDGNSPECRKLEKAATEFTCQGLELDSTLVLWGYDYVWDGKDWVSRKGRPNPLITDPHGLRANTYRVLLTRARDGIILYIPKDERLKQTYEVVLKSSFSLNNAKGHGSPAPVVGGAT